MMKRRHNEGFSLVEVLVAMVVLALVVIPVCSSLVMSFRMNAKADEMMQAQLAVSSAVETLMAEGIDSTRASIPANQESVVYDVIMENGAVTKDEFPGVTVTINATGSQERVYYNVTVSSDPSGDDGESLVSVTTTIRAKGAENG